MGRFGQSGRDPLKLRWAPHRSGHAGAAPFHRVIAGFTMSFPSVKEMPFVPIVKGWITGMANDVMSPGALALAADLF